MTGRLVMFFIEYLVQAGLFFTIPLFVGVAGAGGHVRRNRRPGSPPSTPTPTPRS
jgi:hypothetical protein